MLRRLRVSEEPELQQQVHHLLHPRPRSPARAPQRRGVLEDQQLRRVPQVRVLPMDELLQHQLRSLLPRQGEEQPDGLHEHLPGGVQRGRAHAQHLLLVGHHLGGGESGRSLRPPALHPYDLMTFLYINDQSNSDFNS